MFHDRHDEDADKLKIEMRQQCYVICKVFLKKQDQNVVVDQQMFAMMMSLLSAQCVTVGVTECRLNVLVVLCLVGNRWGENTYYV